MVPFSQLVIRKTLARSALLATCLSLSGCDPLTDLLLDCIDDDGPVLSPRVIPNPVLNQSYDVLPMYSNARFESPEHQPNSVTTALILVFALKTPITATSMGTSTAGQAVVYADITPNVFIT